MERTKTHESQYASSLIEASLDPLITINTEGIITDMNEAFIKITGSPRNKITGTDFGIYFTEPQKARQVYKEVFTKGFVTNYPLTVIDGQLTYVLFNGSVYRDEEGNVLGAVVVARDLTEQKKIEQELIEARIFAEKAKLKAELATQTAKDAAKAKQQFLSNMSHEIRTPMNAIIGFTKVVLKTTLTPKQTEYLTAIKVSGDALIVLINDILDLAKVDAGKMIFEQTSFKMAVSISAMLHLFEMKIREKNLELVIEYDDAIPESLMGDPIRLHQIILNLVSNAVKFTSKGKITVSVRMVNQNEERVTIEFAVTDTGIGIAADKLRDVFENFQQASSVTSRLYGGTGLGLAIVKQLVELQGGTVHVESKTGTGSVFSFLLTFSKTTDEAVVEKTVPELDETMKGKRVLIVEDILLNQLLMKTIMDDYGFEWDIAPNGRIAIEKLKAKAFDIVLMDIQMPEMNGFDATEFIRKKMNSTIPVIALTADVTAIDLENCRMVGMDEHIAKPVDEKLLYTKMVSLLKKTTMPVAVEKERSETKIVARHTNMDYLMRRTKSNPKLMMEIIAVYLEQTPLLVKMIKKSFRDKEWETLHAAIHKMIPSFLIVGINADVEMMARKVQEFAHICEQEEETNKLVIQLENVCIHACEELEEELNTLKNRSLEQRN